MTPPRLSPGTHPAPCEACRGAGFVAASPGLRGFVRPCPSCFGTRVRDVPAAPDRRADPGFLDALRAGERAGGGEGS